MKPWWSWVMGSSHDQHISVHDYFERKREFSAKRQKHPKVESPTDRPERKDLPDVMEIPITPYVRTVQERAESGTIYKYAIRSLPQIWRRTSPRPNSDLRKVLNLHTDLARLNRRLKTSSRASNGVEKRWRIQRNCDKNKRHSSAS